MANIMTPSLMPGERSLPAELRTARGGNFAQRRLAVGLQPSAMPTSWNGMSWRPRIAGLRGLGQDDDEPTYTDTITEPTPAPINYPVTNPNVQSLSQDFTWVTDPTSTSAITTAATSSYAAPSSVLGGQPTVVSPTASTPAAPNGYQWATLVNQSGQNLAKILTIAQGGSSVTLPNGTQLLYGSSTGSSASALSSLSAVTGLSSNTILLVGLAVGAFLLLGNRK